MSRIGRSPISIPSGVQITQKDNDVQVKGPKGVLNFTIPVKIRLTVDGSTASVARDDDSNEGKSLHGMARNQIANMVQGVNEGFTRELEINGVGYRAEAKGKQLHMALGFSHPVIYDLPEGISAVVDGKKTRITLSGIDKQVLGNTAAKIRSFRPPEPYKGKGVKYVEERIRRKEGKSAGK